MDNFVRQNFDYPVIFIFPVTFRIKTSPELTHAYVTTRIELLQNEMLKKVVRQQSRLFHLIEKN